MKISKKLIYIIGLSILIISFIELLIYNQPGQIKANNTNSFKYGGNRFDDSEKVIRDSFIYENDHNLSKLRESYSSRYSDSNFRLDNLVSVKILEIKILEKEANYNDYFSYGRGRINNIEKKNLIIYKVKYYVEYKDQTKEPMNSGEYERAYYLIRENNVGNWKIDDIGVDYYE
ncbi:DUF4829 domain-containing protein [Desulfosporosinus sp. SYSU MS00001]|uniref:DUF4829 domain-containing protein n=1 Tax=Desulfosporosinus sp. SYSU MS00001 TaxID=3416284 RepID=UPI003CFACD25